MANARLERQTPVLGVKVSAYATAGRGVEHGYVSDMHDEHPSDPLLSLDGPEVRIDVRFRFAA